MLGDSSCSVLATTTTTAAGVGVAGGGGSDQPTLPLGGGRGHESTGEVGHVGSNNSAGEDDNRRGGAGDEGDRSFGGNRWPRQETLALLKIRSDMDVAFRDVSVKGPLWDEVSRKLAELGYNRSAKKCKEKFENVYKYHKRTKEGRTGKQEGKTYRFFDQLEAFENPPPSLSSPLLPSQPPPPKPQTPVVTTIAMPVVNPQRPPPHHHSNPSAASVGASHISTISSTAAAATTLATNVSQGIVTTGINLTIPPTNPTVLPSPQAANPTKNLPQTTNIPSSNFSPDLLSNSTSSSTSSDAELQGRRKRKRNTRKWKDFFERLMKEVIHKQEDMQRKFLEAIEKREHDGVVREEYWRTQEMARINREREILAQERSIAAAKDAAVMAFLQKLSEQQPNPAGQVQNNPPQLQAQPAPTPASAPAPAPVPVSVQQPLPVAQAPASASAPAPVTQPAINLEPKSDNGDQTFSPASSSRWPKIEVEALIQLRTNLDSKYQENGPKGPLWEEISAGMRKLGYNRKAKRCKEKWENINKYFKKVKESSKKRPGDSKTCPYFHQLDAIYKEKSNKGEIIHGASSSSNIQLKPENSVPLMVRPEQQWPPPPPPPQQDSVMEDLETDDHENHQDEDDNNDDDDDDDEAGGYEIVANRAASMSSTG